MTIKKQYILWNIILSAIITLCFVLFIYIYETNYLNFKIKDNTNILLNKFAPIIENNFKKNKLNYVKNNLNIISTLPHVETSFIIQSSGKIISNEVKSPNYFLNLAKNNSINIKLSNNFGEFFIILKKVKFQEESFALIIYAIFISLLLVTLSGILSNFTAKKFFAPIYELTEIATKIRTGELSLQDIENLKNIHLTYKGSNEIGVLTQAMRLTFQHLANSHRQLTSKTRALSKSVLDVKVAIKAKSEFLANISHELRTPMHAILGYAEISMDDHESDHLENIKYIHENAKRLLTILNDLLDLSKLEASKMEFSFSNHDIVFLHQEVIKQCAPLFTKKNITINSKVNTNISKLYIDRERISQVFWNIMSNSIKFSPENSKINIEVSKIKLQNKSDAIEICFIDEGPGIPENELACIFDPFVQSSKTKSGAGGTGLGLSICKKIMLAHNGTISAHNNPKVGAKIILVFPIKDT